MFKTKLLSALVCLAILAVGGCTETSNGTPVSSSGPASPEGTVASTPNSAANAPAITSPLDVSTFIKSPCLSITSSQAQELTISPQGVPDTRDTPTCIWKYGPNHEWRISVGYVVPDAKNGLQNLYSQNATGSFSKGYFEPTKINSYPGAYNSDSDDRTKGQCELSVGVNEQTMVTVIANGPNNTDLCMGAAKVATDVVETIKRG